MTSSVPEVGPKWQECIDDAQDDPVEIIGGREFPRVRYGEERDGQPSHCSDCACEIGQIHVPGCDVERCPVCRTGQALTCTCLDAKGPVQ